jgi:hypothetical protein
LSRSDYGSTLKFDSTNGIPVGSVVYSSDQKTIPPGSLQVTSVTQGSVQLSGTLSKYVPAGTVVSFTGPSPSGDPTSDIRDITCKISAVVTITGSWCSRQ